MTRTSEAAPPEAPSGVADGLLARESRETGGLPPFAAGVARALGAAVVLIPFAWALDLHRRAGLVLYGEQIILVVLGVALACVFVMVPPRGGRRAGPVPARDWVLGAAALAAALYFAVDFDNVVASAPYRPWHLFALSLVLIVAGVEAVRRTVGWPLTVIILAFILYAMFGEYLPGGLAAQSVNWERLAIYLAVDPSALLGSPLQVAVGTVILFILFGQLLERSHGALFFNDLAVALMGRYRGGSAKIAIATGALFGTISGSAVANVVVSGVLTIPMMRRAGYKPHSAAAIEAVSSTGGQLVPPVMGAAAFLMAEFLQVSYATIVVAALIPAALFYIANFVFVDLVAAREGIKGEDPARVPALSATLLRGSHFLAPFVVLIVALFWMNQSVEFSALAAGATIVVLSLAIPYRGHRLSVRDIPTAFAKAGFASLDIIVVCAAAGFVIGVINVTGIGFDMTLRLVFLAEQSLLLLLLIAAVLCVILGMGMPTTGVYVLLATVMVPGLVQAGLEPIAAHMFVFYLGMLSMITPPVALASFTAATLAGCTPLKAGFASVKVGWTAFVVPFLFIYQPALLMQGEGLWIALVVGLDVAGVVLGTMAIVGYGVFGPLGRAHRLVYAAAGAAFLSPFQDAGANLAMAGCGALVVLAGALVERRRRR